MAAAGKKRKSGTGYWRLRRALWQGIFLVGLGALLAAGFNAVRAIGLPWAGTWSAVSLASSKLEGLREIPLAEAWSLSQAGKALFVDARDPMPFYEGHIKGALNCPPGEVKSYLAEIRVLALSGLVVVAYCDGVDCPLSTELARSLQQAGVPSVRVLVDGWSRWSQAGYPIEKSNR
jgi:rhodanese-related sulfurtransferase